MKITPFRGTVLTLGFAAMLGGCYIEGDLDTTSPLATSVKRVTFSEYIPFDPHHHTLSSREAAHLKEIIHRSSRPGPVYARLVVRKLQARVDDPLADPRIASVVRFLEQTGVEPHRIEIIEEEHKTQSGLWLSIDQYIPLLPQCPGADVQIMDGRAPRKAEIHFGCSIESNFAAMIAEPKDLCKGHQLSPSDPVVNANAINRLRTDKTKSLKIEKTGTANNVAAPATS